MVPQMRDKAAPNPSHYHMKKTNDEPISSTPPISRSIKIVPAPLNSLQLQQENYEAFVHGRDDKMYSRIAMGRSRGNPPLVVLNHSPDDVEPEKETSYEEEEGIFEIDL
ncbi:hypothetical protein FisN_24Lu135 [Fistulifera solaris]|uniref:Uncharacterized protein n=1 Tax=Fistulifera solaris TaxID=1519565 RepID=A0A1Z5K9M5_FISSO|nr:hypothetical protein FisN_24Lu135 [Fistulifera solaris]|eukprot:GAX22845.1 hypothetical protein FisN_24Lu135 [Fistulifera solaris]